MITRIEIDGFKTFQDFSVDLAPFQVIIGQNGSGKSNLFDAFNLLSRLSQKELYTAFSDLRDESHELFTIYPNGEKAKRMRFTVEMLIDRKVADSWGREADIAYPRLRYDLTISRRIGPKGFEQYYIDHEKLESIPIETDTWWLKYEPSIRASWRPKLTMRPASFISTIHDSDSIKIKLQNVEEPREWNAAEIKATVLSSISTAEYAHEFAVGQEMGNWRFLHMNPEVLRKKSLLFENSPLAVGNDIPLLLFILKRDNPQLLRDISRDLASFVPNIDQVNVEYDDYHNSYIVHIDMHDKRRFSLPALSDGTLRLLKLVILANFPKSRGTLCVEEPENGIHPGALKKLVYLLRDMATDLADPMQEEEPLRQLLATTHSPVLVSELNLEKGELLFSELVTRIQKGQPPMQVTRITPVCSGTEEDKGYQAYTLAQVLKYLDNIDSQAMRNDLLEAMR